MLLFDKKKNWYYLLLSDRRIGKFIWPKWLWYRMEACEAAVTAPQFSTPLSAMGWGWPKQEGRSHSTYPLMGSDISSAKE